MKYIVDDKDFVEIELYIKFNNSGADVLDNKELEQLDKNKLPDNVRKEVTKWRREDWATRSLIDSMSTKQLTDGTYQIDPNKYSEVFIQCLLREWTLHEVDPKLKLTYVDRGDVQLISADSMRFIKKMPANIMNTLFAKALSALRDGGIDLKK